MNLPWRIELSHSASSAFEWALARSPVKSIVENGMSLELTIEQRQTDTGIAYWRARYSFATGMGSARLHGITVALHATEETAELAALGLARRQGWAAGSAKK